MGQYNLFETFNAKKGGVYLPYVMLGFPTVEKSLEVCRALIEEGVHGLELGFPFADPVADGPILQDAAATALKNGFKLDQAISLIQSIRALNSEIPLTGMAYYNSVNAWGAERFVRTFSDAGLDGLLIPDLPPQCAEELLPFAEEYDIRLVFIASPNTPSERIDLIAQKASAFIYVVTKLGITGTGSDYDQNLKKLFARLSQSSNLPAIAGFGISNPEDARKMIASGADGVIVGSKLIELIKNDLEEGHTNNQSIREHTRLMLHVLS